MQIQIQHIFRHESRGRKSGDKQFVDHPLALHPNGWGRGGCRMGCYNQTREPARLGSGELQDNRTECESFRSQDEYTPALVGRPDASGPPLDLGACSHSYRAMTPRPAVRTSVRGAALPYNPSRRTRIWEGTSVRVVAYVAMTLVARFKSPR